MMLKHLCKTNLLLFLFVIIVMHSVHAKVHDNRYMPLFDRSLFWLDNSESFFGVEIHAATADSAYGVDEKIVGIPEIHGEFDQKLLDDARVLLGRDKLVPTEFQGLMLPWQLDGRLQMQGINFAWHQRVTHHFSFGATWTFMRVNNSHKYLFLSNGLPNSASREDQRRANIKSTDSDELELDKVRRQMYKDIGITRSLSEQKGFGDIDTYIRVGGSWEYELKCRTVHTGVKFGTLIPTGEKRELFSPASIPFGGNGHWGLYGAVDADFEIKEDWKVGLSFRVSKRLAKTRLERYPLAGEPSIFGAVVDNMGVKPGVTINFSPYIAFENLRDGFGLAVQYMMTSHQADRLTDKRCDKTISVDLCALEKQSKWGSSYFSFQAFYDFDKMSPQRSLGPVLYMRWDVPYKLFVTSRSLDTHNVGIGFEFTF